MRRESEGEKETEKDNLKLSLLFTGEEEQSHLHSKTENALTVRN